VPYLSTLGPDQPSNRASAARNIIIIGTLLLILRMSNPTGIARTAPIAIASRKPPPPSVDINDGRDSLRSNNNILSASTGSTASTESAPNTRARRDRPCDACRRRKSRCVIHEGQPSCVLCQFHRQECTFVQSPQPRKRKLTEGREESLAKRRYDRLCPPAHVDTSTDVSPLAIPL
jgi:hypothetical protein